MQPNQKQKIIIDKIISIIESWKYSNDIDSPSHFTYITEELNLLELGEIINENDSNCLKQNLENLLISIT